MTRRRPDPRVAGLVPWYQPIVDLESGSVSGFEALLRRVDADGSVHSIGGIIAELERDEESAYAVIRRVLEGIRADIVPVFPAHGNFYVSINIPPTVLGTGRIATMLDEVGLAPWIRRLVVELTERQALSELGRSAIETARSMGISVAVDDFGTGHSGLAQIVGLDLDILKIDRSLVVPSLTNRTAARLLRGIVGLAAALRLRTVAEGVETWEQAFFLRAAGVDYGQGFYWSRAVAGKDVPAVLARGYSQLLDRPAD